MLLAALLFAIAVTTTGFAAAEELNFDLDLEQEQITQAEQLWTETEGSAASQAAARRSEVRSNRRWRTYIAPFYGTAILDRIQGSGVGTGQIVEEQIDGRLKQGRIDDIVAGISAGIERSFGKYAIGLDASFRYRTDWDLAAPTPSLQTITNILSDVQATSTILYFGRNWNYRASQFTIGAGAGAVFSLVESEYIERENPGIRPLERFTAVDYSVDFSWAGFANWSHPISRNWDIGLGYRYSDLGTLRTGDFIERPGEFETKHTSHDIIISLKRRVF